jgi:hypothetical protein
VNNRKLRNRKNIEIIKNIRLFKNSESVNLLKTLLLIRMWGLVFVQQKFLSFANAVHFDFNGFVIKQGFVTLCFLLRYVVTL